MLSSNPATMDAANSNRNSTCVPLGTEGTGYYTTHAAHAGTTNQLLRHQVFALIDAYKADHSGAFVICDYGCSDGGISNNMWLQAIDILKSKYGSSKEICLIHNDLPHNDFKSIFLRSHGQLGEGSYTKQKPGVCVLACGTSFYQQCLLSGSVDLAFSSIALHWLSHRPGNVSAIIPKGQNNDLISRQAAIDWENFLLLRAMEMKPGGVGLFMLATSQNPMHAYIIEASCQQLYTRDLITKTEVDAMQLNYYVRTRSEVEAPFHGPGSRVRAAGLELVEHQDLAPPCMLYKQYCNDLKRRVLDAVDRYSAGIMASHRGWTYNRLLNALSDSRGPEEKEAIMKDLYQYMQETIAINPDAHIYENQYSVVTVRKQMSI